VPKLLWIALAGALGTLCRYGLGGLVHKHIESVFPWGTAIINILGCLAFGLLWSWMEDRVWVSGEARAAVLVGFLGGFTTFSSFVFETGQLLRDSEWLLALGNLSLQNVVGLAALFVGLKLGAMI
jgi:fluoride exporter